LHALLTKRAPPAPGSVQVILQLAGSLIKNRKLHRP